MYDNAEMEKESKVLFFGSLPGEFSNRDFETLLSGFAGVEKCFIIRGKGCGIAIFETDEQADSALLELNGSEIEGTPIFISYANKKKAIWFPEMPFDLNLSAFPV